MHWGHVKSGLQLHSCVGHHQFAQRISFWAESPRVIVKFFHKHHGEGFTSLFPWRS